jgi:hypothetical protein
MRAPNSFSRRWEGISSPMVAALMYDANLPDTGDSLKFGLHWKHRGIQVMCVHMHLWGQFSLLTRVATGITASLCARTKN